ncbi:MAG: peroxiredoxin-like family protein [Thiogranum sp.]
MSTSRCFLVVLFYLLATTAAAQDLRLPTERKSNAATPAELLGTNEDGIGLRPGSTVPDFTTSSLGGRPVTWQSLLQRAPLLIVFYRGGWCPYCNAQIHALSQAAAAFRQRGMTPVLISVDKVDGAALVKRSYEIPYPVLSDPGLAAHKAFQVVRDVDKKYQAYKEYGVDLEQWSGRKHHKIAYASVFVVDRRGVVRWAHASSEFKTRPSNAQLLAVIDGLGDMR